MITVYGLKNCGICRKAMKWLAAEGVDARLHDLRADGLTSDMLDAWGSALGWEALLNRRGMTWRGLSDADKDGVEGARAAALMLDHPALIKRPVFDLGGGFVVGFRDTEKSRIRAATS